MLGIQALKGGDTYIIFVFTISPVIFYLFSVDAPGLIGHGNGIFHGGSPMNTGKGKTS